MREAWFERGEVGGWEWIKNLDYFDKSRKRRESCQVGGGGGDDDNALSLTINETWKNWEKKRKWGKGLFLWLALKYI